MNPQPIEIQSLKLAQPAPSRTRVPSQTGRTIRRGATVGAPEPSLPGGDISGLAQLVLRRTRFVIVLAAVTLALRDARGGTLDLAGAQPAAWAGVALLVGVVVVGIAGKVIPSAQTGVLTRRWLFLLGDLVFIVAIIGLFPRLSGVTWALLGIPLVEAGLVAGAAGSVAAWVVSLPLLVAVSPLTVTDAAAELLARAGVLLLISAPLGVVSRGLMSATSAAYYEHARADARSAALTVVAESAADVVHRDQRDADRVLLDTLRQLGAISASLWGEDDHEGQVVAPLSSGATSQRSVRPHPSAAVATTGGVWVDLPDRHTVDILIVATGLARRRVVAGFATELTEDDGILDAVRLLARHVAVAWANAGEFEALEAARNQLSEQTRRDPLTGLANRTALLEVLEAGCRRQRPGQTQSLLFIDMDGFKEINDTLGHRAGDAVLCQVADLLVEHVRPDDFVARLGGDEFCILVRNTPEPDGAQTTASRLISALETRITPQGSVSASIGIARMSPTSTPEGLLSQADTQMYRAKNAGGRRYSHA